MIARIAALVWPSAPARKALSILLLLFSLQQLAIIIIFPPFSGHDEVAHFDYARLLAQEQRLPIIPDLDEWRDQTAAGSDPHGDVISPALYAYCLFTLEWWPCEPDNPALASDPPYEAISDIDGERYPIAWQYAANHPPLFYLLAAPVQWLIDGQGLGLQIRILRLLAIPFGLLMVAGTFALARQITPRNGFVPIAAATFVAFQPQVAFSAAIFNNDVTVIAVGAWLLALLAEGMRSGFTRQTVIGIGLLLGIGLLFKGTAIVFTPVTALALVLGIGWRDVRGWLAKGAAIAAIGFGVASPWYLYLWRTYGSLDALDRVERLQAIWNYPDGAPSFFGLLVDGSFIERFWREFWGGFGWRRIPLDDGPLWLFGIVCAICAAGICVEIARSLVNRPGSGDANAASNGIAVRQTFVLMAMIVIAYLAVIQFGTTFMLAQARYAFPAIPALAVVLAIGLYSLVPTGARRYALILWVAFFLAMAAYIYSAYVIPYWYLGPPR